MTLHALLIDPPRPGLVLPHLAETTPLSTEETAELYAAMVKDTIRSVTTSGGELLVNYRPAELLPEEYQTNENVLDEITTMANQALDDPDAARYEVQVGDSYATRVSNTVTHLLLEEHEDSVAVIDGTAPTITRATLDSAAMKLRRSSLVLAPSPGGGVSYVGMTEPIDFSAIFDGPELVTLVDAGNAAEQSIDFLPIHPQVTTEPNLTTLVALLTARNRSGRQIPPFTMDTINRFNLSVEREQHQVRVTR